jgi:hypothetical protein
MSTLSLSRREWTEVSERGRALVYVRYAAIRAYTVRVEKEKNGMEAFGSRDARDRISSP